MAIYVPEHRNTSFAQKGGRNGRKPEQITWILSHYRFTLRLSPLTQEKEKWEEEVYRSFDADTGDLLDTQQWLSKSYCTGWQRHELR